MATYPGALTEVRVLLDDVIDRANELRRAFGSGTPGSRASGLGNVHMAKFAGGYFPELAREYYKAFALGEFVAYQRAERAIARHRDEYDRILDLVGEVDAALSIAYLRMHDDVLRDCVLDPHATTISCKALRHPLIEDAVGNDLDLGPRGLLITGSNMAGKSTLLRALGVNLVLARSFGLVAADSWRSPPLRIATAMRIQDDLAAGLSTYRAEVDRIHDLVRRADGHHLFVLDEIFRGTNPHERVAASAAVLHHLARTDLVVAATHDRELCTLLEDAFSFGHFAEQVDGKDVLFDYRLRPGIVRATNAIAILERTGFPQTIVAEAHRIASRDPGNV